MHRSALILLLFISCQLYAQTDTPSTTAIAQSRLKTATIWNVPLPPIISEVDRQMGNAISRNTDSTKTLEYFFSPLGLLDSFHRYTGPSEYERIIYTYKHGEAVKQEEYFKVEHRNKVIEIKQEPNGDEVYTHYENKRLRHISKSRNGIIYESRSYFENNGFKDSSLYFYNSSTETSVVERFMNGKAATRKTEHWTVKHGHVDSFCVVFEQFQKGEERMKDYRHEFKVLDNDSLLIPDNNPWPLLYNKVHFADRTIPKLEISPKLPALFTDAKLVHRTEVENIHSFTGSVFRSYKTLHYTFY